MRNEEEKKETSQVVRVKRGNITVKVYTRMVNGGTYFVVADYSSGSRKFRTFTTLQEARLEAELIASRMAVSDRDVLELRSDDRASYIRATNLLAPLGIPLELAVAQFVEACGILGQATPLVEAARFYKKRSPSLSRSKPVPDVVREFLADKETKGKSPRYLQDLRYRTERFAEKVTIPIADVTTAQIEDFLSGLKLSTQSYANFRRVLVTLCEFAKRRGYVPRDWNEAAQVERISVRNGEIEIFTPAELARLLAAADKEFVPALAIGAFSGLRSAEIERLEWSEVRLGESLIEVKKGNAKTASRRLVPIGDALSSWLRPYGDRKGRIWPFSHVSFYNAQRDTAKATQTSETPGVRWKSNALRHSYISYRLALTQDQNRVALESGNSPAMIHRHYKQLVSRESAESWFALDLNSVRRRKDRSGASGSAPPSRVKSTQVSQDPTPLK